MLRRTGFKSKAPARAERDPDRVRPTPTPSAAFRLADQVYVDEFNPLAKPEAHRNPFLLSMARGQSCLLRVPGVCCGDRDTVVACHSNWAEHGKSGARKADDCYTVHGCRTCHAWLDQGKAPAEEKRERWDMAFRWMRAIWWDIAAGMQAATPKERAAAQWAIDHTTARK